MQRMTGYTGRMLLKAVMNTSEGKKVCVTADSLYTCKILFTQSMNILNNTFGQSVENVIASQSYKESQIILNNGGELLFIIDARLETYGKPDSRAESYDMYLVDNSVSVKLDEQLEARKL